MPSKKIIGEAKSFVVQEIARFSKPAEIVQALKEQYGVEVRVGSVYAVKKRNRKEIAQARRQHVAELDSIPLRHRKERILRLVKYLEAAEKGMPVAVKTARGIEYRIRPDYQLCIKILERIRDEVRDEELRTDDSVPTDRDDTLTHLQRRYAEVHMTLGHQPVSLRSKENPLREGLGSSDPRKDRNAT
jgi:hypothetical protein